MDNRVGVSNGRGGWVEQLTPCVAGTSLGSGLPLAADDGPGNRRLDAGLVTNYFVVPPTKSAIGVHGMHPTLCRLRFDLGQFVVSFDLQNQVLLLFRVQPDDESGT